MTLTAKNEGGDFTPAPAGNHVAIAYGVVDLGTQHSDAFTYEGKLVPTTDKQQILIMWELPHELVEITNPDSSKDMKPAVISNFYNNSLNKKANLRIHLEAWRSRAFTEEELFGFNVGNVLGKPCMLNVIHKANGKAKITSVAAMPKGADVPVQFNESILFDLSNFDREKFEKLSDGIQNLIKKSVEWQQNDFLGVRGGFRDPVPSGDPMGDDFGDVPF